VPAPGGDESESLRATALDVGQSITEAMETAYFWNPIPDPLDLKISSFINRFAMAQESERIDLARIFTDKHALLLDAFAIRMASLAVRQGSSEPIAWGLVALTLDCGQFDDRETVPAVVTLYDAALRIEVDSKELFENAAAVARKYCGRLVDHLLKFHDLPSHARNLDAARMTPSADVDGFRYEPVLSS
jgi:hypothetical protein